MAWTITVLVVITGFLALHHLGLNLSAALSSALHGLEHWLGQPLVLP